MNESPGGRRRGSHAEEIAALWLQWKGWTVLDRNRRAGGGEIDLVARDGPTLVFVEVRARREGSWVAATSSLGADKRRRLRACARLLALEPAWRWRGRRLRFDLVALRHRREGFELEHWRNLPL